MAHFVQQVENTVEVSHLVVPYSSQESFEGPLLLLESEGLVVECRGEEVVVLHDGVPDGELHA